MLESGHLSPLQDHHHRTTNRILIPLPRILLVWTPAQSYQRSRPSIHIPLWSSTDKRTGNPTKHLHRFPPPNGWPHRADEPMGGTVLKIDNGELRRLEQLAE